MPYPTYPQYQQYPSYQQYQPYPQIQQPQVPQVQVPQVQSVQTPAYTAPQGLNGKFVDSIESVKATDVMMDGSVMYFPVTDGKTIYTKQLQGDGTSKILAFALVDQTQESENTLNVTDIIDKKLKTFRDDILGGFEDINDRFDKIERQLKPKTTARDKDK